MKRREFIQQTASVAGLSFVGCGLGGMLSAAEHGDKRRQVIINGKRMLTVDIHCHSYVHDVWPLIEDRDDIDYLRPLVGNEPLKNKIDLNNVDFRLQQMDQQGIDVQAVSLHVGQYHHWADRDLATQIVRVRRESKGRRGKTVTTISGIPLPEDELLALAGELKRRCGTGGCPSGRTATWTTSS